MTWRVGLRVDASWRLMRQVARSWLDNYVLSMGAALAYYTVFSLSPLLLIVVSVAGEPQKETSMPHQVV